MPVERAQFRAVVVAGVAVVFVDGAQVLAADLLQAFVDIPEGVLLPAFERPALHLTHGLCPPAPRASKAAPGRV